MVPLYSMTSNSVKQFVQVFKKLIPLSTMLLFIQNSYIFAQTINNRDSLAKEVAQLESKIGSTDKIILLFGGLGIVKNIAIASDGVNEKLKASPGIALGIGYKKIRFINSSLILLNSTEFLSKGNYSYELTFPSTVSKGKSQLLFLQIAMEIGMVITPKKDIFLSAGFFYGFRDFGMNAIGAITKIGSLDDDEWGLKISATKKINAGFLGLTLENALKSPADYQNNKTFRCSIQYGHRILNKTKKIKLR